MAFVDYYKILGVDKNIPQKDVRAAYRKRAKQFHPDLHPDDPKAKAKFQALSEAFEVIGDPDKRAKYDKYGEQWRSADAFNGFGGGGFGGNAGGGRNPFEGFDFSNFGGMGGSGGFSSFFQDLFGGGGSQRTTYRREKPKPQTQEVQADIDFYTAILGGEVIVQLPDGKKVKLKMKPYTQNGTKVRLKSKGPNLGNGVHGDLIISYNVKLPTNLSEHQKELLKQMRDSFV